MDDSLISNVRAPWHLVRHRLLHALTVRADFPLRFLCCPDGSGKSTLLHDYVASTPHARYIAIVEGMSPMASIAALEPVDARTELIFDDLDNASSAEIDVLLGAIAIGKLRRVIVAGCSRRLLQSHDLVARGLACVLDASDLAFDLDEARCLAEALELRYDTEDIIEVMHITEGWAIALSRIFRGATRDTRSIRGAFERWSQRHGQLFLNHIAETAAHDDTVRAAFMTALEDEIGGARPALGHLELAGCPILSSRGVLRPYRILTRLASMNSRAAGSRSTAQHAPLLLTLLGRFACRIDERSVLFARRRDQNVLIYVALAHEARASREDLREAFWPGIQHAMALQALRTTLSRLRRSIADASGAGSERFLVIDNDVALNLDNVYVDARRFVEHDECGHREEERGEVASARRHYQAAERLYTDHLLSSEAIEPALAQNVRALKQRFDEVVERLIDISVTERDLDAARGYERRARPRPLASAH